MEFVGAQNPSKFNLYDMIYKFDVARWLTADEATRDEMSHNMSESFRLFGFAGLINHDSQGNTLHSKSSEFFYLSHDQKMKYCQHAAYAPGYNPPNMESTGLSIDGNRSDTTDNTVFREEKLALKPSDLIESWNFWKSDSSEQHSTAFPFKPALRGVDGGNTDPPPAPLPTMFTQSEQYATKMKRLTSILNEVTDMAFGLPPGTLDGTHGPDSKDSDMVMLKLSHYFRLSPCSPEASTAEGISTKADGRGSCSSGDSDSGDSGGVLGGGAMRYGEHSDVTSFTILRTDGVPGLEVFVASPHPQSSGSKSSGRAANTSINTSTSTVTVTDAGDTHREDDGQHTAEGTWCPLCPDPSLDMLIVNIGDFMMRATNGYWRSAYHRVAPVTAESRLSIIWFYSPPSSYVVQSLVAVVKYGESKFAPLTAGEYLNMQLARASQGSVEKVTDII